MVRVWFPEDLYSDASIRAKAEGLTLSAWIRRVLILAIKQQDRERRIAP